MSRPVATPPLMKLAEVADELRIEGKDRERSVRRLFKKHKIDIVAFGGRGFRVTADQYAALLEAMRCSGRSPRRGIRGSRSANCDDVTLARPPNRRGAEA